MSTIVTAYVGLGANLDEPAARLSRVFRDLADLPETVLRARSPLYKSAPLGPQDQPDFINAVAALDTGLAPLSLLAELRAIEVRHGRRRDGTRWGPRRLDLDLLLYGALALDTPELSLPHPGMPQRSFVLYPLYDIAPDLVIPGQGTVATLKAGLEDPRIQRLES